MNTTTQKTVHVADIIELMEDLAPAHLAEEWDNCGLQLGHRQWLVRKIWVALDPLPAVIQAASRNQVDLVISHHPLIFKPLSSIDLETAAGATIETALNHQIAVYTAHTNLDSAFGGINDVLADKIGLSKLSALVPSVQSDEDAYIDLNGKPTGLGRVGVLGKPLTVEQLARQIKADFNLERVKVAGDPHRKIHTVAVCSGSGGSLLSSFLASGADVFISGDMKYHDARVVEDAERCLIDIGHFASEHLIIQPLVEYMDAAVQRNGWKIAVEACTLEKDPFELI